MAMTDVNLEGIDRALKEIKDYRDSIAAQADAARVYNVILNDSGAITTATASVTVKPSVGANFTSATFNKYLAAWLSANITAIIPEVSALIDADVSRELSEAGEAAGDMGLAAVPKLPNPPVITSPATAYAVKGQRFEYEILADNIDDTLVTFVDYYAINTVPEWIRIDKANGRHHLVGTVPSNAVAGNKAEFEILVVTNAGSASLPVTVTYVDTLPADPEPSSDPE